MDLSKLPKLSQSPEPPPPQAPEPQRQAVSSASIEPYGIEYVLVATGIGVVLLLFITGPANIFTWLTNPSALPPVTDVDGSSITYRESAFFWADLGATALAVLLVLDGLISGLTRSVVGRVLVALVGVSCLGINLYVCTALRAKIGMQLFNGIAILVALLVLVATLRPVLAARQLKQASR